MSKICHIEITSIKAMPRVLRACEAAKHVNIHSVIIGFGENCIYRNIDFIGVPKPHNRFERFFRTSRRMISIACHSDADIVQLHSPELLFYWKKLRRAGKKVIFDSHEFYVYQIMEKHYIPKHLRKIISRMYYAFESKVLKKIDAVIYPCTINGHNYFDGRSIRCVKIENFSSFMEIKEGKHNPQIVIYAGNLCTDRGIDNDIAAIMKTDGSLVLCGTADKSYLNALLSKYPSDKVKYIGSLQREELFDVYVSSGIGICTLLPVGQYSLLDNMSTKIYEYMQCGLPVIFSAFPYAVKLNNKYHFGIAVDGENVDEIAKAIQFLINNPEEARKMGENGRRAVKEEFNWSIEEKKLLALYDEILKDGEKTK